MWSWCHNCSDFGRKNARLNTTVTHDGWVVDEWPTWHECLYCGEGVAQLTRGLDPIPDRAILRSWGFYNFHLLMWWKITIIYWVSRCIQDWFKHLQLLFKWTPPWNPCENGWTTLVSCRFRADATPWRPWHRLKTRLLGARRGGSRKAISNMVRFG